jgi:exopolysaccharide biosynthesis polyprenyl glycosylphosphotransferase
MNPARRLAHHEAFTLTRTRQEKLFILLCFLTEALLFWAALNAGVLARLPTLVYIDLWRLQLDRLICVALFGVGAVFAGAYDIFRIEDPFDAVYYSWAGLLLTGLFEIGMVFLVPVEIRAISRREIVIGVLIAAPLLGIWRVVASKLIAHFGSLRRAFYILGREADGLRIAKEITLRQGRIADAEYLPIEIARGRALSNTTRNGDAIIALGDEIRDELPELLSLCEKNCRRVYLYPSIEEARLFRHGAVHAVAGIPLIELPMNGSDTPYIYLKRLIDFVFALIGLILSFPLCLLVAAAIAATSRGGVFYAQVRVGRNGRKFRLYKFRSMIADAEAQTGPIFATANDDRVTPVGRFIRKHRLDEFPQLWNILKGDMSLIGPRPERPHFHEEFQGVWPLFEKRLSVRPGLTSLSHVLGSYDSNLEDRLRYDLIYIGNLSLLMDLRILFSTIRVVLGAKGAQ